MDGMVDADDPIPPGCGDGAKTATEPCDGADLGGATCASAAAPGWVGIVSCTASCKINVAACNVPASTWNLDFTDKTKWTGYNVGQQIPGATGFAGSAFDGRYLYLVPSGVGGPSGLVARYDTSSEFANSASWSTFDLAPVSAAAKGFQGGAFDGRYVYFVPYSNGA